MPAATFRSKRRIALLAEVEKHVLGYPGLETVYTRVGEQPRGSSEITEDTVGVIQFEFGNWQTREPAQQDHGCDPRKDRGYPRRDG